VNERALTLAALVTAGRLLTRKELSTLLGGPAAAVRGLDAVRSLLTDQALGLEMEEVAGGYRLVVSRALVPELADLLSPAPLPRLSEAALETLALIAYRQPATRGELEAARGASCQSTIDTLAERELIRVTGRKDVVGRPLLYGTTERFLVEFGLNSIQDLPSVEKGEAGILR
jgi:segregation and condensation protein B